MKLRNALPREALGVEWRDQKYNEYLDLEVLETITEYDSRFPFKHKNIHVWWILENMMAVGWNENPSRGWSFPVSRVKIKGRCEYCANFSDDIRLCYVKTMAGWDGTKYKLCKNCRSIFYINGWCKLVKTGGKKRGTRKEG